MTDHTKLILSLTDTIENTPFVTGISVKYASAKEIAAVMDTEEVISAKSVEENYSPPISKKDAIRNLPKIIGQIGADQEILSVYFFSASAEHYVLRSSVTGEEYDFIKASQWPCADF